MLDQEKKQIRHFRDICEKEEYKVHFVFSFLLCDKRNKHGVVDDKEISKRLKKKKYAGEILIFDASQLSELEPFRKCPEKQFSNRKKSEK
jgi:hypothetical protein